MLRPRRRQRYFCYNAKNVLLEKPSFPQNCTLKVARLMGKIGLDRPFKPVEPCNQNAAKITVLIKYKPS